ncbi:MAG: NAD(P)H-dependent glycerol-3-phosphate dehydrogenase [Blastochloris sp.]|jgi:glycerol-3-phosphate dehydrogenase (NAD(P)+)|nr:NAD(P)H-dependent glycerol-3-phosphate dehydrogenase [Blastochloris sp.]
MKISVIGKGAWGSAMGRALTRNGHEVIYLGRNEREWQSGGAGDFVLLAVPCQSIRSRLLELPPPGVAVFSLVKGIEIHSKKRVTEVVEEIWPGHVTGAISGPSLASEVEADSPTALVVASMDEVWSKLVQKAIHQRLLRTYRSSDVIGVELGGALKNVYALAGGMCQGLGLGENGLAGLMTRSLGEMMRLAVSLGAKAETLSGLSGMGDLILTAYSGESRNHKVGIALGKGRDLQEILRHLNGTAEGVPTAKAVHELVQERGIKAPVAEQIYQVLYKGKTPAEGFKALMMREVSEE